MSLSQGLFCLKLILCKENTCINKKSGIMTDKNGIIKAFVLHHAKASQKNIDARVAFVLTWERNFVFCAIVLIGTVSLKTELELT